MDDVGGRPQLPDDGRHQAHRHGLDQRRAGRVSEPVQLLPEELDHLLALGVNGTPQSGARHGAKTLEDEFGRSRAEALELVDSLRRRMVGEQLEADRPAIGHRLRPGRIREPGARVEGEVDQALGLPQLAAHLEGLRGAARGVGDRHLEQGGHPGGCRRPRFGAECGPLGVAGRPAVEVGIHRAGNDQQTRSVHLRASRAEATLRRDLDDTIPLQADIRRTGTAVAHHRPPDDPQVEHQPAPA